MTFIFYTTFCNDIERILYTSWLFGFVYENFLVYEVTFIWVDLCMTWLDLTWLDTETGNEKIKPKQWRNLVQLIKRFTILFFFLFWKKKWKKSLAKSFQCLVYCKGIILSNLYQKRWFKSDICWRLLVFFLNFWFITYYILLILKIDLTNTI